MQTARIRHDRRVIETAGAYFSSSKLLPYERRIIAVYASVYGSVARELGRIAAVLGRHEEADAHFDVALELHERIRAPYWIACTDLDRCDMLERRRGPGDDDRARELRGRAHEVARSLGYHTLVTR